MPKPFVSIIVANWQGEDWIARTVSSLLLSARGLSRPFELIVVDDASTDNSVQIIRDRFAHVHAIVNECNVGFRQTIMNGIHAARGKVIVLCNNDLAAKESFVPSLVRWFEEPQIKLGGGETLPRKKLFGVSARTISWYDGAPNQLCMGAMWKGGRISPAWKDSQHPAKCLFVQAGAAAYNRAYFLKLGGLSKLYEPGYWEDYDLSYRAFKLGLYSIYDPNALALHHGGGSMQRRFGAAGVNRMKARNHLLFEWANLTDAELGLRHALRLPVSVAMEWMHGNTPHLTRAILDALPRLPVVLRNRIRNGTMRSDREALTLVDGLQPSDYDS